MNSLWIFVIFSLAGCSGKSFSKNSELCRPWTCVNTNLGLGESRDGTRHGTRDALRNLLPPGVWQDTIDDIVDVCYYNASKPRRYTDTCPGQAGLHCIVDRLIENCPETSLRKNDVCSPVSSFAGLKHMFSQGTYENLEKNLPQQYRHSWHMDDYFSSKCCNIAELINATVLSECGFNTFLRHQNHNLLTNMHVKSLFPQHNVRIYPKRFSAHDTMMNEPDPMSCCDLRDFVNPSDATDCGFAMRWSETGRLVIMNTTKASTTTTMASSTTSSTASPIRGNVVKVVPLSCAQETCVFKNLGIVSESGTVDLDAFSKLLDNFTRDYPDWVKAKARVVTKCLSKPIRDYEADCEINKVLACTFDVLSENCPHAKKSDPCKHSHVYRNDTVCQISTSKYGPKHRRRFCDFPRIVDHSALLACDVAGVSSIVPVADVTPASGFTKPRYAMHRWQSYKPVCTQTESAFCVMDKLGVMNKYKFMDHFKMKNLIRKFTTTHAEWSALQEVYFSSLYLTSRYTGHCTSERKLLNVIETMILTCPISKRKDSVPCTTLYNQLSIQSKDSNTEIRVPIDPMYSLQSSQLSTVRTPFQNSPYVPTPYNSNLAIYPHIDFGHGRKKFSWGFKTQAISRKL